MSQLELQKIWDPVTRLWHWVLAFVVVTNWSFGKFMSFDTILWHFYLGYTVLGLLAFRILWGFIGPEPVRWQSLLFSPVDVVGYLRGILRRQPSGTPGHNPLGSLSVLALLIVLMGQACSGLFLVSDDFFESAPLASYASEAVINRMTWWHHLSSKVLLVLVIAHLLAIIFYLFWKHENLIKPMINGWKWVRVKTSDRTDIDMDSELK